jgi:hypothetical protein
LLNGLPADARKKLGQFAAMRNRLDCSLHIPAMPLALTWRTKIIAIQVFFVTVGSGNVALANKFVL